MPLSSLCLWIWVSPGHTMVTPRRLCGHAEVWTAHMRHLGHWHHLWGEDGRMTKSGFAKFQRWMNYSVCAVCQGQDVSLLMLASGRSQSWWWSPSSGGELGPLSVSRHLADADSDADSNCCCSEKWPPGQVTFRPRSLQSRTCCLCAGHPPIPLSLAPSRPWSEDDDCQLVMTVYILEWIHLLIIWQTVVGKLYRVWPLIAVECWSNHPSVNSFTHSKFCVNRYSVRFSLSLLLTLPN